MDTSVTPPKISETPAKPEPIKPFWKRPENQWMNWALGAALVLLLVLMLWLLVFNKPKATSTITEAVAYHDLEKTVLATGLVVPFLEINVGSRASGTVTNLMVDVGDTVRQGEVIAMIDAKTQTNNLQTAQAALIDSQSQRTAQMANLDQALAAYGRAQGLYAADAMAKSEVELAAKALKSARAMVSSVNAQIQQARIAVKTSNVNLGYTRIVAPIDGTVLAVVTKQGQTVNAAQSAPTIVTLGQLAKITIKAEIAEADVIKVAPGMKVYFTILGDPDQPYYATLRRIEPAPTTFVSNLTTTSTASNAVYYYGLFDVDNAKGRLRTSMTANVSIILDSARHVLTIPSAALGGKNKDGLYAVQILGKDQKPVTHYIGIGLDDGTKVQVISGLKLGDKVVLGDSSTLPKASATDRVPGMRRSGGL